MRISDWSSDVCSSDLIARQTAVARQVGMVQHVIIEAVACQDVAAIIGLVERPVVAQPLGTEHQNAVVAQLVVFDDGQGLEGFAETDAIGDYAAADALQL